MVVLNKLNVKYGVIILYIINCYFLYLEWVFFFINVCVIDKFVIEINDNKFI